MSETKPIPMLLFCPRCHTQHIDAPEPGRGAFAPGALGYVPTGTDAWTNPPHKSHLCHSCGCVWRPADVHTTGVATITTRGERDNWKVEG